MIADHAAAPDVPSRLLIAIGGNAIHPAGIKGSGAEQAAIAAAAARTLLPLLEADTELIFTHGNGPGVGKLRMRQALARHRVEPMPMDICVANSQGGIGYVLMQAFANALRERGNARRVACLLVQVKVDPADPAFFDPTKPVVPFSPPPKPTPSRASWVGSCARTPDAAGGELCHPARAAWSTLRSSRISAAGVRS